MSEFLDFAVKLAKEAGEVIMQYHGPALERDYTDKTHFKTLVDNKNDELAWNAITKHFPMHNILSEESAPRQNDSDFTWVVDGLDGTIGFSSGIVDHFAFCIALCRGTTPIVGVVNAPKRNQLFWAEVGGGSFCNGERIQVSNLTDPSKAFIPCYSGKFNRDAHLPFKQRLYDRNAAGWMPDTACASVVMCFVAKGDLHAFLATSLNPEDMAAAVIINREAGAKATNRWGEEWQLGDPSVLVANPILHQKYMGIFEGIPLPSKKGDE